MPVLSRSEVACWLIKTARSPAELAPGWVPGTDRSLVRCLRPSYRLELMEPGQPCLLWLSGRRDPGVHAVGTLRTAPREAAVEIAVRLLAEPVPRDELLASVFSGAEVVRMPAGSNPSWLDHRQWAAVRDRLEPADLRAAGWGRVGPDRGAGRA